MYTYYICVYMCIIYMCVYMYIYIYFKSFNFEVEYLDF